MKDQVKIRTLFFFIVFCLTAFTTGISASETEIKLPVTVLDASGKPMAEVGVFINLQYGESRGDDETIDVLKTDEHGKTTVTIRPDWKDVFLLAEFPEHVAMEASWSRWKKPETELPKAVSLTLEKSITIGGRVVDAEGKPIAEVEVLMYFHYAQEPIISRHVRSSHNLKTDADGRWTWDCVPDDDKISIDMHLRHPDYFFVRQEIARKPNSHKISLGQLREKTAVFVLKHDDRPKVEIKHVPITGKVVDADGKPVPKAIVYYSFDIHGNGHPILTREDGTFRLGAIPEHKIALTFAVDGFQPVVRYVDVPAWSEDVNVEPVQVQLKPGKRIEIRFVDEENRPVSLVNVAASYRGDDFSGFAPLHNYNHRVSPHLHGDQRKAFTKIPDRSDENGVYIWDWAPEEEITLRFWKEGFDSIYWQKITARMEPYTIVMKPGLVVSGRVVDEATGQAIPEYMFGRSELNFAGHTDYWSDERQTGETFKAFLQTATAAQRFRVTAEDYEPFLSEEYPASTKNVELDVKLRKAEVKTCMLYLPNGTPAGDVDVFAGTKLDPLTEYGLPELRSDNRKPTATTDEQGRFDLTVLEKPYFLYAVTEEGYAIASEADIEKDPTIRMKPWGGLEIRFPLTTGRRAMNRIQIEHADYPYRYWDRAHRLVLQHWFSAASTETGYLQVEKIATGKWKVLQYDKFMANPQHPHLHSYLATRTFTLEVKPGEKTSFAVPEGKAEIVGKIVLPESWRGKFDAQDWDGDYAMIVPQTVYEAMRKAHPNESPNRVCFKSAEYREETGLVTKYSAGLDQTPENPDAATFRFSKVLPGEYVFSVQIRKRQKREDNGGLTNDKPSQSVGVATFLFVIPGDSDDIDLGTLELDAQDGEPKPRTI